MHLTGGLPALVVAWCCIAGPAVAQNAGADSVEGMVQQLQRPRTRNLVIQAQPQDAAHAAHAATPAAPVDRPSLSLLIQFDFDSATVSTESRELVTKLTHALRAPELAGSRFAVEGHTDNQGRADYNLKLSQRRAQAVRELLMRGGVEGARLVALGKGSNEPANAADPRAPENRRVRVVNLD